MGAFRTLNETRLLGHPVVGVFRTALGRDPTGPELEDCVTVLREGAGLPALAERVMASPEFQARTADTSARELVASMCENAFGPGRVAVEAAQLGEALQASPADMVATIASLALGQGRIPLLPGLAPGAAPDDPVAYGLWVESYGKSLPPLVEAPPAGDAPLVSVLMSVGDTNAEAAVRTIASLQQQYHANWRLCLRVRTLSPWSQEAVTEACRSELRVEILEGGEPWQRWLAAPARLACWLSPGDRLPAQALAEVCASFAAHPRAALVFTDEDVEQGGVRLSPRFKPAYSPGGCGAGLIGQLAVYRADLLAGLGLSALPDSQDALARQAAEAAGAARVWHLPGVLCHRAEPPEPVVPPARTGVRRTEGPLVSVLVPTRDRAELLRTCLDGVLNRTDYPALEVVIADNGSAEPDALALLAELAQDERVRVLSCPGPFNFAALTNAAARAARGEVLLLLNNDTEVCEPGWLAELVAHAGQPGVGVVGARLLYPSGLVQHAGILLGPDGRATHVGRGAAADDPGYLGQLGCVRDLSAVTGACLAISSEVWRQVGGMDERLAVTWNDVDLCLKVRQHGLRVVWTPHATLFHKEAATRGLESEDPARVARFRAEQAIMRERWGDAIEHDPFLNPNLVATEAGPLCLAPPRARRVNRNLPRGAEAGTCP